MIDPLRRPLSRSPSPLSSRALYTSLLSLFTLSLSLFARNEQYTQSSFIYSLSIFVIAFVTRESRVARSVNRISHQKLNKKSLSLSPFTLSLPSRTDARFTTCTTRILLSTSRTSYPLQFCRFALFETTSTRQIV